MDSKSLSHTKWNCLIVFIPKYRRRVMYGQLRSDVRVKIRKLCEYKGVEIVEGMVIKALQGKGNNLLAKPLRAFRRCKQ